MLSSSLIRDINQSWLYFWFQAATELSLPCLFQASDLRTGSSDSVEAATEYLIAHPVNEWRVSVQAPGTLDVNFRLQVVTGQRPGETLKAHSRNLEIQVLIQDLLFGSDRWVTGFSTGSRELYALPLRIFDTNGDSTALIDTHGLQYSAGNGWIDQTPVGANLQTWLLELPVSVTR